MNNKAIKATPRQREKLTFKQYVKTRKFRKNLFISIGLFWPIIHFLVFFVYIYIDTIMLSFQRFDIFSGKYVFYGFSNFENLFKNMQGYPNKTLQYAMLNSLAFLPWNTVVLLPLSLIAAYILNKKIPGQRVFRVIFFLPSVISIVVLTMVFKFTFDSTIGIMNPVLKALNLGHLIPEGGWLANMHTAFPMILLYCLWAGIGYNVVLVTGAMIRIPSEVTESAKLDGIGFFREFWSITIPMISPTINTLIITGSSAVFTLFLQPMLLTGGMPDGTTYTISYLINEQVRGPSSNLTGAATMGIFFSLIGVPFVLGLKALVGKLLPDVEY